jgi:hypothetical protein
VIAHDVPQLCISISISPLRHDGTRHYFCPIKKFTYLSIYLSIDLSIYRSIYLSIYHVIYRSLYQSIDRSITLSTDHSIYLSIYRSIYHSIYLSLYRSITLYLDIDISTGPATPTMARQKVSTTTSVVMEVAHRCYSFVDYHRR